MCLKHILYKLGKISPRCIYCNTNVPWKHYVTKRRPSQWLKSIWLQLKEMSKIDQLWIGADWYNTCHKCIRPWVQSPSHQKVTTVLWQKCNFMNYIKSHWILYFEVVNCIKNYISIQLYVQHIRSCHIYHTCFYNFFTWNHFSEIYPCEKFAFNCSIVWLKITSPLPIPLFFSYTKKCYNKYPYTFSSCSDHCDNFLG